MFDNIITILYFILVLTIVVFIHEFGHYIVAKVFGVKIVEFSIGMWQKIFGFKDKSGTEWKICLLPVGGYVKMYGDQNGSSFNGYSENPTDDDLKYSLIYKHPFKKILVAFAGPFMNFVLAFFLFFAVFSIHGKPFNEPIVGKVASKSYAEKAGIKNGDKVISVDGNKITSFNEIKFYLQYSNKKIINFKVKRNSEILNIKAKYDNRLSNFGISSDKVKYRHISAIQALKDSGFFIFDITYKTGQAIFNLIAHQKGLKNIGGPIAIAKESGKAGKAGVWSLLYFIAILSVSLGAINLLPVPLLDGGHIVINFIELITKKHFSNNAYRIFVYIGILFIFSLMGLGFINDLFFNK